VLAVSHVRKYHAGSIVLDDVSLAVPPESRIGIVGPNGVGKSTLLRVMAGLELPDSGTVTRAPPSLAVGYLPQEVDARPRESLLGYLARRTGVARAEAELDRCAAALADGSGAGAAYADALERFLALGGAELERRARSVCRDLGLHVAPGARMGALSGGERARAALAAILLARFDLFLLDEPTNDLDFDGLERLERFLTPLHAAVVVVSHDRVFLDRTVTQIVELEDGTRHAREYSGGWSDYESARERERAAQYRRFEEVEERRREFEAALRQRRAEARGGDSLARRTGGADRRGTHAQRSRVRHAQRGLERLEAAEKPWEPWELRLAFEPERRAGDVVVRLERAVLSRGRFRLGPLDVEIGWGERVAVAGPNGSGKTTLLCAVLGDLPLADGRRYVGPGVVLGELDQERRRFGGGEPVLAAFMRATSLPLPGARSLLAKFGLGADDVERAGTSLSPGERTRAALALLVARRVNCLVLDEPTNHLDLPGIEELETALAAFPGAVVLVTHDRRFLERFEPTRALDVSAFAGVTP
jgi:ATPase subunit of ABC transporter with duplicated ATPase domains